MVDGEYDCAMRERNRTKQYQARVKHDEIQVIKTNKTNRMKSIKEKAKEYGLLNPYIHYNNGHIYDNHDKPAEDFEAGANYVFEQIENLVKTTMADGDTYHYNLYIGLVNLLEQLKK